MALPKEKVQELQAWKEQKQAESLQSQLDMASTRNTSQDIEVLTLSDQSGLPFDTVERNLPAVRQRANAPQFDAIDIVRNSPRTAAWLGTGSNALAAKDDVKPMRDLEWELWQRKQSIPFWRNTAKLAGERVNDITGNLLEFAGNTSTSLEEFARGAGLPNPGIVFGDDGMSWSWDVNTQEDGNLLQNVGEAVSEGSLGGQANFSWENFKGEPSIKNLTGYVIETGASSLVDMAAMLATMPAYLASRTEEIAEQRVANNGEEDVGMADLLSAAPTAVAVSLIDFYSTKGMLGMLDDTPVGAGLKHGVTEVMKAGFREGVTEFVQEQVEYAGETLGTEKDFDWGESLDRGAAGLFAGGPMGAVVRSVSLPANAMRHKMQKDITQRVNSMTDQMSIDRTIEAVQSMTLAQESPEKMRNFLAGLEGEDKIYMAPEEVTAAAEAGLAVPQYLLDRVAQNGSADVEMTVTEFGMDVIADEQLLSQFREHLKLKPDALSQKEIAEKKPEDLRDLVLRVKEDAEIRTEADEIHRNVTDQLVASGRLTQQEADVSAQVVPAYVTTKVEELRSRGIEVTPMEVYDKMNFRIEADAGTETDGTVLRQPEQAEVLESIPSATLARMPVTIPQMVDGEVRMVQVSASEAKADIKAERSAYESLLNCTRGA